MSGWGLAIDYGTSFTAAALVSAEGGEVIEVEDSRRFPSSVLLAESGELLVGRGLSTRRAVSPTASSALPSACSASPQRSSGDAPWRSSRWWRACSPASARPLV